MNPNFNCNPESHKIHEDLDDPYDYVKLWFHYNENCLPHPDSGVDIGHEDRFFRRIAPKKVRDERMKKGITFTAGLEGQQLIGKSYFPKMMREIAVECNFLNPERQTAASLCSEHICTLVNAEDTIDSLVIMNSSRHKSEEAHNCYKRKSKSQLDKKTVAFHKEKKKVIMVRILFIHLFLLHSNLLIHIFYFS